MSENANEPRLSATLVLVRDGKDGLEVFMVQRHHEIDFATGAFVFPGGKVNDADYDPKLKSHCHEASQYDEKSLALRIACIREAFEECGVLYAGEEGSLKKISCDRLKELEPYRKKLDSGKISTLEFIEKEKIVFKPEELSVFAHWITPEGLPKRYDTHFFIAKAPKEHDACHDGRESVSSMWIRPEELIEKGEKGDVSLLFPTKLNLMKLAESYSVDDAIATARSTTVVTVCPKIIQDDKGYLLQIPVEAGYAQNSERFSKP